METLLAGRDALMGAKPAEAKWAGQFVALAGGFDTEQGFLPSRTWTRCRRRIRSTFIWPRCTITVWYGR
jgi:hypothetical protein